MDYTGDGKHNIDITENAKPFFGFEGRKIGINKTNTYKKEVKKVNRPYFEMIVKKVKRLKEKHSSPTEITIDGKKYTLSEDKDENVYLHKEKGNWVNGENLDKIKFPCLCSYIVVLTGEKRYGKLDKGWDDIAYKNNYIISNIEKQTTDMSILYVDTSLKKLMINLKIKILKGKIILFEEEK